MKLPNSSAAIIEAGKIRDYLLSREHPVGRFKAVYIETLGFDAANWQQLADAIRVLADTGDARISERTQYGQKFTVLGMIRGQSGSQALIVSVWIVLNSQTIPRFITAYPGG